MAPSELEAHVTELADKLGVSVEVCEDSDEFPLPTGATIIENGEAYTYLSHAPDSTDTYLLALHELGHAATQRGVRVKFRQCGGQRRLLDECLAWRWALENACITPGPQEWEQIFVRLCSYAMDKRFKYDPDFHSLFSEAERKAFVRSDDLGGDEAGAGEPG